MRPISVNFGPEYGGRVGDVRYQVTQSDGTVTIPMTNSGIAELWPNSGVYGVNLPWNSAWGAVEILWTLTGTNLASAVTIGEAVATVPWTSSSPNGGFSFDPTLVSDHPLHYIRMRLGDTDSQTACLSDAEINGTVQALGVRKAAVQMAYTLATIFARRAKDSTNEQTRVNFGERSQEILSLARQLEVDEFPSGLMADPFSKITQSGSIQTPGRLIC